MGCQKEVGPASLVGSTWSFQSAVVVTTPLNGGSSTSSPRPLAAGSYVYTYRADGTYLIKAPGGDFPGTYTYSGTTLILTSTILHGPPPRTLSVTELSAHRLVTVEDTETGGNRYSDTVISTR